MLNTTTASAMSAMLDGMGGCSMSLQMKLLGTYWCGALHTRRPTSAKQQNSFHVCRSENI